jgi:sodium transport system permease protein
MRWPIVRLIWHRELRDLVRDRRWLFMLLGLPVLLYPAFGLVGLLFALATIDQKTPVGVYGTENLPQPRPNAPLGPTADVAWLAAVPRPGLSVADLVAAGAVAEACARHTTDPPLFAGDGFVSDFGDELRDLGALRVVRLDSPDRGPLDAKQVHAILVIPIDFAEKLRSGGRPAVEVLSREGDEISKLATKRLGNVLASYRRALRQARFMREGLPADFDQVFTVRDPDVGKRLIDRTLDELRDVLVKFLPFMLVMWSMAGALYPAIDLCAGEKERGTMETLLISPAGRAEIVAGKYLAVWLLAAVTALWNLIWMGGGALLGAAALGMPLIRPIGLFWCAVFVVPLAALYSGLCLALGVYARSTKEGQYYLMPIFLGTMPLVTLSLAPGIELNLGTSLIPITGACLLLQQLMQPSADITAGHYVIPVLGSLAACVGLALWWAEAQFRREDVLFREAERLDLRTWLRTAFRPRALPAVRAAHPPPPSRS